MKHIFTVQTQEELAHYQAHVQKIQDKFSLFLDFLSRTYQVTDLPRAIVWTNKETATHLISDIPLPAYTNEYRTVFCPALEVWREIYLHQLDRQDNPEVRSYYETRLTENHVLQILGHEFVHHSKLFVEDFETYYESSVWFEEGMCEYISRKFFLTEQEFHEEAHINTLLVEQFRETYGTHTLDSFGAATYLGDYASIFYEYWRSFLAVNQLVEAKNGDVMAVFQKYRQWYSSGREQPLTEWFHVTI